MKDWKVAIPLHLVCCKNSAETCSRRVSHKWKIATKISIEDGATSNRAHNWKYLWRKHDIYVIRCNEIPFRLVRWRNIKPNSECHEPISFPMKTFFGVLWNYYIFFWFLSFSLLLRQKFVVWRVWGHQKYKVKGTVKTCTNCNYTNYVWIAWDTSFSVCTNFVLSSWAL